MRICSARIFFAVAVLSLLPFAGCGDSESSSSGGASSGSASSSTSSGPRAGYATGKILHQNGKPIDVKGAKLSVNIAGISGKSGEKVYYNPKINADGTYEQKLVDGTYAFAGAWIEVPFDGKQFRFDLEPVGDDKVDRESEKGIVQDYVWKLTGLRPGEEANATSFTDYYGASIGLQFNFYREDIKKSVSKPPAGTKAVFTVTPVGKLIDGSDGKPQTFEREYDPLMNGLKNDSIHDLPIAVYTIRGEEVTADGAGKPLKMKLGYDKFADSFEVHFSPGTGNGTWPTNVGYTRDE